MKRLLRILAAALLVVASFAAVQAAVPYNSDIWGKNAPIVTVIDPVGDKVTVTNPGQEFNTSVIFIDAFGDTLRAYPTAPLANGKTAFDVPLRDGMGSVGVCTDYYLVPAKKIDANGIPVLGSQLNTDFALHNVIAYQIGRAHV